MYQVVDLFVGTSAGSIASAIWASGLLTGKQSNTIIQDTLPKVFAKRFRLPGTPKYSSKPVRDAFKVSLGDILMRDTKTKYMSTAVNMCSGRSSYFKSWQDTWNTTRRPDGMLPLIDVVERSFAAPLYFGSIVDHERNAVWMDGGAGLDNCPVKQAFIETKLQGWLQNEEVHILSIGTGEADHSIPFVDAEKAGNLQQIMFYSDPADGGLARNQSTADSVMFLYALEGIVPRFNFERVSFSLTKEQDGMDKLKYLPLYRENGRMMGDKICLLPFNKKKAGI